MWQRSTTNNQLYRDPEYVTRYTGTSRVNEVQFAFPPPGTFLDSTAFARDTTFQTTQTNTVDCTSGIERFVWAGDNILWEMRGPGANTETVDRLEQGRSTPWAWSTAL